MIDQRRDGKEDVLFREGGSPRANISGVENMFFNLVYYSTRSEIESDMEIHVRGRCEFWLGIGPYGPLSLALKKGLTLLLSRILIFKVEFVSMGMAGIP